MQIDGIKVPYSPKREGFARRTFMRTDVQLAEFENTFTRSINEISAGLVLPEEDRYPYFHCSPTACSDFGGCPFIDVCMHGKDHPLVKERFNDKS